MVDDIVRIFRTQGDPLVAALLAAANEADTARCARLAHKLRGAAVSVGAVRLGAEAAALEQDVLRGGVESLLVARVEALAGTWAATLVALEGARAIARGVSAPESDH